jgi:hypothetical protein
MHAGSSCCANHATGTPTHGREPLNRGSDYVPGGLYVARCGSQIPWRTGAAP